VDKEGEAEEDRVLIAAQDEEIASTDANSRAATAGTPRKSYDEETFSEIEQPDTILQSKEDSSATITSKCCRIV
jgi:hypothetical protein